MTMPLLSVRVKIVVTEFDNLFILKTTNFTIINLYGKQRIGERYYEYGNCKF